MTVVKAINEAKTNADISPCLSVVMPAYNEQASVLQALTLVLRQPPVQEVIVVDDASTDNTWPLLQEFARDQPRLRLFRHERNQGKGASLRTGFGHIPLKLRPSSLRPLSLRNPDCVHRDPAEPRPASPRPPSASFFHHPGALFPK